MTQTYPYWLTVFAVFWLFLINASSVHATTCKLKSPLPDGCGVHGYIQDDIFNIYEPQVVPTLEDCAALCARRVAASKLIQYTTYCIGLRYNSRNNLCQLGKRFADDVTPRPASSEVYYDSACFDCGPICSQPLGAELLDNGDFKQKLLGPWNAVNAMILKGHNYYHCSLSNTRNCALFQTFNGCFASGQVFRYQFDYMIIPSKNNSKPISLGLVSGRLNYDVLSSLSGTKTWKTVVTYFHPDRHTIEHDFQGFGYVSFPIGLGNKNDKADVFIANVSVSRVPETPRLATPEKSVIQNAGFESGSLAPWKKRPGYTIVSPGINSKYAVFTEPRGHYQLTPHLVQTLVTRPNTSYLFSLDILTTGGTDWDLELTFITPHSRAEHFYFLASPSNYTTVSLPVYSDASTMTLNVYPFQIQSQGGNITFDNFKMVEIDQPKYFP